PLLFGEAPLIPSVNSLSLHDALPIYASALFKKMDELQNKIMQAQQAGQPLSAEDQQAYKDLNDQVQKNDKIVSLLTNEQGLYDLDRKSTRLNSSHVSISYAVFCLKKK